MTLFRFKSTIAPVLAVIAVVFAAVVASKVVIWVACAAIAVVLAATSPWIVPIVEFIDEIELSCDISFCFRLSISDFKFDEYP